MPQRRKAATSGPPATSRRRSTTPRNPSATLKEHAYSRLRAEILNGLIAPGAGLQEADLSQRLGISRTPLREAICRLAEEGLVEVLPYRGARVIRLDNDHLDDLFQVREIVEGLAARLAATRMSKQDVAKSRRSLKVRLRETDRRTSVYRAPTLDFHQELLRASGNRLLIDIAGRLYARLSLARAVSGAFRERAADAAREHLAVLDSIARREADAAERLTRRHVRRSHENLLRYLEELSREQERTWTG